METLFGSKTDLERFQLLTYKPHLEQTVHFLNVFWKTPLNGERLAFKDDATLREQLWIWAHDILEISKRSATDPLSVSSLDAFGYHIFLEKIGRPCSFLEAQADLAALDINKDHRVCVTEFLLSTFRADPRLLVNEPIESDETLDIIERARRSVESATSSLSQAQLKSNFHKDELSKAVMSLLTASAQAAQAQGLVEFKSLRSIKHIEKETELTACSDEVEQNLRKSWEDLRDVEVNRERERKRLLARTRDPKLSQVERARASFELEGVSLKDQLPFRRAKLCLQAALRKYYKEKGILIDANSDYLELAVASQIHDDQLDLIQIASKAAEAREEMMSLELQAKLAYQEAEAALEKSVIQVTKANALLELTKKTLVGSHAGTFWWMERELEEGMKYMSKKQLAQFDKASMLANQKEEVLARGLNLPKH